MAATRTGPEPAWGNHWPGPRRWGNLTGVRGPEGGGQRIALVTGVGRRAGIGAALATRLAADGWGVALTYWRAYDERMPWPSTPDEPSDIAAEIGSAGRRSLAVEADLTRPEAPSEVFAAAEEELGPVTALVMAHAESVDSDLRTTTVESFDRHMAVNARATWLLVREFAERWRGSFGAGRIVALTSDHTAGNLPYGASKGALDRIVLAAARELAGLGVTANVVNPGPNDTGWIAPDLHERLAAATPLGRVGTPRDTAALVSFLCSPEGGWVNGQLLHSDGGFSA
jgi:3-oxoacyl-[acyl-carrier protein] reductase